jgi:hypothetical protein
MEARLARYVRTFTFDEQTINQVSTLILGGPESASLRCLLGEAPRTQNLELPAQQPQLDDKDLLVSDYQALYAKINVSLTPEVLHKLSSGVVIYSEPPALNWTDFLKHFRRVQDVPLSRLVHEDIKARRQANKKLLRKFLTNALKVQKPKPEPIVAVNASRVYDALVRLGLETLEERVHELGAESQRGKAKDVGQSSNKLSNTKRRKAATLRTVSGRPRAANLA